MAKAKTKQAGATAAQTKKKATAAPRKKAAGPPVDEQTAPPPPQPEPSTEAEAAPPKGAAEVHVPKSRREASLPKGAVLVAKAGTTGTLDAAKDLPLPTGEGEPPPAAAEDTTMCYIRMPVRVLVEHARQWAAYYQKRFATRVELMNPDGKGVLERFDNVDGRDRVATYTPLGFPWHPNWEAPAPKPCNGNRASIATAEGQEPAKQSAPKPKQATAGHPRKGNPELPVARVLKLCLAPGGASPAALKQIGRHCAGDTYLQRLAVVHKLTLTKLPNGNIQFSKTEGEE